METLLQDLRFGARMLLKKPGFTSIAVLTLALGIGVNSAIFTVFNIMLRHLPVKDPDTIVKLEYQSQTRGNRFSYPNYVYCRDNTQVFSDLIASEQEKFLLGAKSAAEETEEIIGDFVSDNFFDVLGGGAALGHTFLPEENSVPGKEPVVVLSHYFWQSRFAGDPNIIGRTLQLNGKPFTVVGVTDPEFVGLSREMPDIWLPLMMRAEMPTVWDVLPPKEQWFGKRSFQWLSVTGRLKPDHKIEEARAELAVLLGRLSSQGTDVSPQDSVRVNPASGLRAVATSDLVNFGIILSATSIVLLIACSNLANLLLARAAVRQKEIGVRLSLGASRWRVIRQLLTESFLLAFLGGGAGLLLAWWTLELLVTNFISSNGGADTNHLAVDLTPDVRILTFTFLLSLLSGLVFGLAPALRATRTDMVTMLKDEGAGFGGRLTRSWLHNGLVVAQVALCLVLLIPAGLLLRGLVRALGTDPGFETKNLLIVGYSLELSGYDQTRARLFNQRLLERLAALPGVESISTGDAPLSVWRTTISVPENDELRVQAYCNEVTSGWFETVGIPIIRGRGFTPEEMRPDSGVVVVSESTARNLWHDEEPLGKELRVKQNSTALDSDAPRFEVVRVIGVARDAQNARLGEVPRYFAYLPDESRQYLDTRILLRTSGDASEMKLAVRAEVRALEPVIRLWLDAMDESIATSRWVGETRGAAQLATGLGLLALLLASVGLYGVMAYAVTQRTREIGIRMALGAATGDVLKMVLRQGMVLVAVGVIIGVGTSLATTRLLSSFLFGLSATDPLSFVGVALLLAMVALLACYIPARRATKVDPMVALRCE